MYVIVCLGNSPEVYGPFPDQSQLETWLIGHLGVNEMCKNGCEHDEHHMNIVWPVACRICTRPLFSDPTNHPADLSLCWVHDNIDQEVEAGLV